LIPRLFLNAAILLLPYKDPANVEIITQLSKLMPHPIDGSLRLPRPAKQLAHRALIFNAFIRIGIQTAAYPTQPAAAARFLPVSAPAEQKKAAPKGRFTQSSNYRGAAQNFAVKATNIWRPNKS
jgi:hypothetical protein